LIKKYDLNVIFLAGPGHGAHALISNVYLEGTYSEIYSDVSEDADGLQRLFEQFSFPGGIGSHCTLETPGSSSGTRSRTPSAQRSTIPI
jgi:xylulose-5-phosphate/fructose-6-phosphate phosphoketolase